MYKNASRLDGTFLDLLSLDSLQLYSQAVDLTATTFGIIMPTFITPFASDKSVTTLAMDGDDYAGDITTTGVLTVGGSASGTIDFENDQDWFGVMIADEMVIRFENDNGLDISLFDFAGNQVATSDAINGTFSLFADRLDAGQYFISVNGLPYIYQSENYTVSASMIDDDFAGDITTSGTIVIGSTTTGEIDYENDEDWFSFTVADGDFLRITSEGITSFTIKDAMGNVLSSSRLNSDYQGELAINTLDAGEYFISVEGYQTRSYSISTSLIEGDLASDITTTGEITIGTVMFGTRDYHRDVDWYSVQISANEIVSFTTLAFANVELRDSDGRHAPHIINRTGYGDNETTELIADRLDPGEYFLSIASLSGEQYSISSTFISDDYGNDVNTNGAISVGSQVSGAIDYGRDQDWFSIEIDSDDVIRFTLKGNAKLRLLDINGNELALGRYNADEDAVILLAEDLETGNYFVKVSSIDAGTYTLSAPLLQAAPTILTDGDDNYNGTITADYIQALAGNDFINASRGNDIIEAGEGNDTIIGGAGADLIDGGAGIDQARYTNSDGAVVVDLNAGTGTGAHAEGDTLVGIENLSGSNFDDTLTGDTDDNILIGGAGNDTLDGGEGDDRLNGGDGDDILRSGSGNNTLLGGAGDDVFYIEYGDDTLDGGDGIDTVFFNGPSSYYGFYETDGEIQGNTACFQFFSIMNIERLSFTDFTSEIIRGTSIKDTIVTSNGAEHIFASTGDDNINSLGGDDDIDGGGGNDWVNAGSGDDRISAGDGNDTIIGGAGADYINGGAGVDQARYANSDAGVFVALDTGNGSRGHAAGDTLVNIENLLGSRFDDVLIGDSGDNVIDGYNGDDQLFGGHDGNNTLIGGNGDDLFYGGTGADFFNGGSGFGDVIDYSGSTAAVEARLGGSKTFDGGFATGDSFQGIEDLIGSDFDDILVGNVRLNELTGGAGDDYMNGDRGNDIILGGDGNDTLIGGFGQDTLDGGDGIDTARYANANSRAVVNLETGTGTAGHSFGDTLVSIENLFGSNFNDVFVGDANDNVLNGWNGVDRLTGGEGNDTLIGGAGNDRFIFTDNWGDDTITDFEDGGDLLDFRTVTGVDALNDLTIFNDANGDAVVSFGNDSITLLGIDAADITAADFLF